MNCRQIESLLSGDLEGALKAREQAAVSAHMRDCPACRRRRDELVGLEERIREAVHWQPGPFPDFRRRAMDRWLASREARSAVGHRSSPLLRPIPALQASLLGAAALALVAALLSLAERQNRPPRRSGPPQLVRRENTAQPLLPQPSPRQLAAAASTHRIPPLGPAQEWAPDSLARHPRSLGAPQIRRRAPAILSPRPVVDDLVALNADPKLEIRRWVRVPRDQWQQIEDRVRAAIHVRDDFVTIPFPRIASVSDRAITQAVESYKREAAVVDPRLSREVTCAFKATALSDLCAQLRAEAGIELTAGSSVADEKVTVFCEKLPLREVMRQLSRPFGYTWLRSKREGGEYRYELVQDLKSQLLEEDLRNRDHAEALLALDREMGRYRPYLGLSPDEALARSKSAAPEEKKLLETLAIRGWGPVHMYFRLTPPELAALRSGQTLTFSQEPGPGELPLPANMGRGVLECLREVRVKRGGENADAAPGAEASTWRPAGALGIPLTAIPEARAAVRLTLNQSGESELGRLTLDGSSRFSLGPHSFGGGRSAGPYAVGMSHFVLDPGNAVANARLAHDPAVQGKITVEPGGLSAVSRQPSGEGIASPPTADSRRLIAQRVTSADVLEALHAATGRPIVADSYTRLYQPETVSVKNQPLFAALNHLADAMRMRWDKEAPPGSQLPAPSRRSREPGAGVSQKTLVEPGAGWLQFRSVSFYHDRLKEVPNRLLARWAAARRKQGELTLDDLVEISGLSDAQLDAADMAEGARELWGLTEWDLARDRDARRHWRFLALLMPEQRREAMSPIGLAFTRLSLAQQQQFLAVAVDPQAASPTILQELSQAAFRVVYTHPEGYEWPGTGSRVLLQFRPSPVHGRTRDEVLAGARRLDPQVEPAQIVPTELAVTVLYRCGATPDAYVNILRTTPHGTTEYDGRPARVQP